MPTAVSCRQTRDSSSNFVCGRLGDVFAINQHDLACGELLWQFRLHICDARYDKCTPREPSFWAVTCWGRWVSCRELPQGPPQAATVGKGACDYPMALHMGCERKLLALQFCWWTVEKGTQIWMEGAVAWRWNWVFQPESQCFKILLLSFLVNTKKKSMEYKFTCTQSEGSCSFHSQIWRRISLWDTVCLRIMLLITQIWHTFFPFQSLPAKPLWNLSLTKLCH